jgi:SEL1 protein
MTMQFPPTPQFTLDPKVAYDSFSAHASLTGNATSQSYIAFFHATGYHNFVPVDQAKAQLFFTFAANGGDKGAQMALAFRYWSGIGTQESCPRALFWYEAAAEQGMLRSLAAPRIMSDLNCSYDKISIRSTRWSDATANANSSIRSCWRSIWSWC